MPQPGSIKTTFSQFYFVIGNTGPLSYGNYGAYICTGCNIYGNKKDEDCIRSANQGVTAHLQISPIELDSF